MGLIFYDTETTGTNAAFDQILQFAAIRTDDDLNEIDRFETRSRLLPYVIPSPGALRVTGLTIDDLLSSEHPSYYEMVCRIRQALAGWCPSLFVAYNGMRFDEEFMRQAFYQCLHAPYLTNTEGSSRADALALVQTAALLHPGSINVPVNEKGKFTFKLDGLAPANGRWVRGQRDLVRRVIAAMSEGETEYPPSPHVERQIYDGFWSAADTRRLQHFHGAEWPDRVRIAEELEDARLGWLARRIVWVSLARDRSVRPIRRGATARSRRSQGQRRASGGTERQGGGRAGSASDQHHALREGA